MPLFNFRCLRLRAFQHRVGKARHQRSGNNRQQVAQHRRNRPGISRTNSPPCGAISFAPTAMEIAPVTAPPTIQHGRTRIGSRAAKESPFRDKAQAKNQRGFAPSRCPLSNLLRATSVAIPIASGGTIPAAMIAAIGA